MFFKPKKFSEKKSEAITLLKRRKLSASIFLLAVAPMLIYYIKIKID